MHDLIKNGADGTRGFKRSNWVLALLALASIPLVAVSCVSLGKAELGERLAALDKNAAIGELERLDFVGDVGGGPRDLGSCTTTLRGPTALDPRARFLSS